MPAVVTLGHTGGMMPVYIGTHYGILPIHCQCDLERNMVPNHQDHPGKPHS